jgi:hypothetical protein
LRWSEGVTRANQSDLREIALLLGETLRHQPGNLAIQKIGTASKTQPHCPVAPPGEFREIEQVFLPFIHSLPSLPTHIAAKV